MQYIFWRLTFFAPSGHFLQVVQKCHNLPVAYKKPNQSFAILLWAHFYNEMSNLNKIPIFLTDIKLHWIISKFLYYFPIWTNNIGLIKTYLEITWVCNAVKQYLKTYFALGLLVCWTFSGIQSILTVHLVGLNQPHTSSSYGLTGNEINWFNTYFSNVNKKVHGTSVKTNGYARCKWMRQLRGLGSQGSSPIQT